MKFDPDFDLSWCQKLLSSSISVIENPTSKALIDKGVSNSMFAQTLYTPHGIRARTNFKRSTTEPTAIAPWEYCCLLSLGTGIDGKTGRAHGGFNALVLDEMTGTIASMISGAQAPATATMTIDYKAPINTPGVVLCRGWAVERQGKPGFKL